ncbi:hypothetical protein ABBQ32_006471 [Trebouxia sp. C0010 RCD-2024]
MARVPATVVFVQSGEPGDTLKQLVHQICQDQCLLPPLLPLEYENIRYRLHHSASADASPDGDALQAFEWASNPPGMVVYRLWKQSSSTQGTAWPASLHFCKLLDGTRLKRRGCCVAKGWLNTTSLTPSQANQLVPVALPSNPTALAGVADAVADYNRTLADNRPTAPPAATIAAEGSSPSPLASDPHVGRLTAWLAASLAPIGAAVTIQAHWRGRAERQRLGALLPQLLSRRAAVCIQRVWRIYLLRRRIEMLSAVSLQVKALTSMRSTDVVCLQHQAYMRAFRLQQQQRRGLGRPSCFPEQGMLFAFEEGGMVFGVNRPGLARSGIPLWTGVSLPVVDEEDMQPLGADQLFDASQCSQLLTHTTTVEKTQRPSSRGGGQASEWVVLGLDPACPEPDTELQLRAAVLLILTWDIRSRAGVRLWPRPASFFSSELEQNPSFLNPYCLFPSPPGQLADGLFAGNSPVPSALRWRPRPERYAVRVSQLHKLGLLPRGSSRVLLNSDDAIVVPSASSRVCPGQDVDQSEAASSASGPAPPWPTPAQLKQTLAAFGRAQAEETAHILASRAAFDALISKMHVVQLQTHAPRAAPKPSNTSHAFLPATAKMATVAEAVAMTEQLRHSQQAANREVAKEVRARHQAAAEVSKHTLKSAMYWKGAIGRAHCSLTKSALTQVGTAERTAKQGLVLKGQHRQARGKQQRQEGQIMSGYHGRLNMLRAYTQRTDLQHREELQAEAALAAVLKEREEESRRQARIVGQQQQAQHARHAAGNVVRGVPALAGKTRLDILHELQELVNKRCGSTASDGYALIHYCIWKLTLHSSLLPGISSTQPGLGARSRAELPQNTGTIDATATYTS